MTSIAIIGAKGSPGATTLAVVLAALASRDEATLLLEVDPSGGDLAARAGLSLDPGLLTLAAAGRRGLNAELTSSHSQRLASNTDVLVAPASPDHAHAAITGLAHPLSSFISTRRELTIVDAGRWDSSSPATELVRSADVILMVMRPTVTAVEHARARLQGLSGATPIIAVVIGERPYALTEVRAALGDAELVAIPDDRRAATTIGNGARLDRWLRRSDIVRSATVLLDRVRVLDNRQVVAS